jgi:membrane protease YdiL (CAAX protease family)
LRASLRQLARFSFMTVYLVILLLTSFWGLALFSASEVFGDSAKVSALFCLPGVALGLLAVRWDRAIVRRYRRKTSLGTVVLPDFRRGVRRERATGMPPKVNRDSTLPTRFSPDEPAAAALTLVVVAILEELIYRGFLVKACFLLPNPALIVAANIGCLAFFSLGHIRFGWVHVLAKTPLGILALGITLLAGTVLPAMLLHAAFNLSAWKTLRTQG